MTSDRILLWILRTSAVAAGLVTLLIFAFLIRESWPLLTQGSWFRFFTDDLWLPSARQFNLIPILAGTLLTASGALLLAAPCGILSGLFSAIYAGPKLSAFYGRIVELLAGIPSVVYGFWGLTTVVPIINEVNPPGASLLAASIVLAIMIMPTLALSAHASFRSIPGALLNSAYSLGLGPWGILRTAIFPSSQGALLSGIVVQSGRAVGETMAVMMVCGNIVQLPSSVFDPIRTLTTNIALEMAYAMGDHRSALFLTGLLLLTATLIILLIAEVITRANNVA